MPRYFIQLSFNGKNFHGWQLQENAHSVQAEINQALSQLLKQEILSVGCGRTDTGVHARMFFAHFDSQNPIHDSDHFIYHINRMLPFQIAVQNIFAVADNAHARFDATSRTYQYHLHHEKNPFLLESSYFFPYDLDDKKLAEASALLMHYNDFTSFSKSRTQVKTNICNITHASWRRTDDHLIFEITADRFLRNMVRAIVGTLLDVGESRMTLDEFKDVIEKGNRSFAGVSVPAHALYLVDIKYPDRIKESH